MITNIKIGADGRLGNQMFQMAALLGIAAKTGHEVMIPLQNTRPGFGSAMDFSTNKPISYKCDLKDVFSNSVLVNPMDISQLFFLSDKIQPEYEYEEMEFQFNSQVFEAPDNTDFRGYFQSEKYFKHIEDALRKVYTFNAYILEQSIYGLEPVKRDAPLVSIHVRRGDYVGNSQNHTLVGMDYYNTAIETFFSDQPYRFVVFSDDVSYAKSMFDGGYIFQSTNDFASMCAMSMCDHHIIANSSFSWWGAWLNDKTDKKVVSPSQWFGPALRHLNTSDLIPENWFII